MNLLLFVSSNCPHCPRAESLAKRIAPKYIGYGLAYRKIRAKTNEGKVMFSRYGVSGTPTFVITDGNGKELKRMVGVPSEARLRSLIEDMLNLKKRGILNRLFG